MFSCVSVFYCVSVCVCASVFSCVCMCFVCMCVDLHISIGWCVNVFEYEFVIANVFSVFNTRV